VCAASASEVTAFTMTAAPSAARERAIALPMFFAPPVTMATCPASSSRGRIPIIARRLA
jgi:hypothetical protein